MAGSVLKQTLPPETVALASAADGPYGNDTASYDREIASATASLPQVTNPSDRANLQSYIADLQRWRTRATPAGGSFKSGGGATGSWDTPTAATDWGVQQGTGWDDRTPPASGASYAPTTAMGAGQQPQGLIPQMPQQQWTNPGDAVVQDIIKRINDTMGRTRDMYSPEVQAQRKQQNQSEYEMGLLGILSGNEGLATAGGAVLKNALAMRQPRVSEMGVADPITGTFTYNPEAIQQRLQGQLTQAQEMSARLQASHDTMMANQGLHMLLLQGQLEPMGVDAATQTPVVRSKLDPTRLFTYDSNGQLQPFTGQLLKRPLTPRQMDSAGAAVQGADAINTMGQIYNTDPSAAKAGPLESFAASHFGPTSFAAGLTRWGNRQDFFNASMSLAGALKNHIAAGGGTSADMADLQAVLPTYKDSDADVQRKFASMRLLGERLRLRAGPAMGMVNQPTPGAAPIDAGGGGGGVVDFSSLNRRGG